MNLPTAWILACGMLLGAPTGVFANSVASEGTAPIAADPAPSIIAPPVISPGMEFVVIRTEKADYLQSEFSGLPSGTGAVLDSLVVRRQERATYEVGVSLDVHWRWAQAGKDSVFPAVRRVQRLDSLPLPKQFAPVGAIVRMVAVVDTLRTCNEGRCQMAPAPQVVVNYEPRPVVCAIACEREDSATVFAKVREKILASGVVLGLNPVSLLRAGSGSPWVRATGGEQLPGVCQRLPGNRANWIARDLARFNLAPVIYDPGRKVAVPWGLDYPTGPVQYVYQRTASPDSKILEGDEPRLVEDTLVKYGRTLSLAGNIRRVCGRTINDSEVVLDSWLVVPDTPTVEGVERALAPTICGQRTSAWRLVRDTVWLGKEKWPVSLKDLLPTSSVRDGGSGQRLGLMPRLVGTRLELPKEARVEVRDLSGGLLGRPRWLAAGGHGLDLGGYRGGFVVRIGGDTPATALLLKGHSLVR